MLEEHARSHHEAGRDVVVLGPLLTPEGFEMAPWVRWEQEMLMKQYSAMLRGDWPATARQFYTGNASLRRSHILAAGGFDEGFRRAEDVELAYRLANNGLEFVFNIQAAGHAFCRSQLSSVARCCVCLRTQRCDLRARSEPEMAASDDPPRIPGSSFLDPIACAGVQRAIPADPDCKFGAETWRLMAPRSCGLASLSERHTAACSTFNITMDSSTNWMTCTSCSRMSKNPV